MACRTMTLTRVDPACLEPSRMIIRFTQTPANVLKELAEEIGLRLADKECPEVRAELPAENGGEK